MNISEGFIKRPIATSLLIEAFRPRIRHDRPFLISGDDVVMIQV
jgi:hypothetical protein